MTALRDYLALADLELGGPGTWQSLGSGAREIVIMLGAVTGVILLIVVWAVRFRRRRSHAHRHHHHSHHARSEPLTSKEISTNGGEQDNSLKRRKWRRRRRDHRPRNPTLAETGGLPPARPEQPPEPFP